MNLIKSDIVPLYGAATSQQGGRPENQDDYGYIDTPLGCLIIVCDGMGGGPGGKTASYIVKYEIVNTLCGCSPQTSIEYALKMAVSKANEALEKKIREIPSLQGMGSTFVAILINKHSAYIVHAGDSRCYQIRGKKCIYRSNDHSLVAELVAKKALTEEEARVSPQANVITRGLGSVSNNIPEIEEIPYKKGDRFVLCTDGVWGFKPNEDLLKRLALKMELKKLVRTISEEIDIIGNKNGGNHDNHTLVIFDVDADSHLKERTDWKNISLMSVLATAISIALFVILLFTFGKDDEKQEAAKADTMLQISPSQNSMKKQEESTGNADASMEESANHHITVSNDSLRALEKHFKEKESTKLQDKDTKTKSDKDDTKTEQKQTTDSKKQVSPQQKLMEITSAIIEQYSSARNIKHKIVEEAQKMLDESNKIVLSKLALFKDMLKEHEFANKPSLTSKIEAIERKANDKKFNYIDKKTDDQGIHHVANGTIKEIDKQINRLEELKKIIQNN